MHDLLVHVRADPDGFESLAADGRPLVAAAVLAFAERKLGRSLRKAKAGRKPGAAGR